MSTTCDRSPQPFLHRAVTYSSREELLDILAARARGRVDERDPVLVAVDPVSEQQLRKLLGRDAKAVDFVDPSALSGNTAGPIIRRFMATARQRDSSGPVSVLVQHPLGEGHDSDEAWLKLECEVTATLEGIPIDLVCLFSHDGDAQGAPDAVRRTHTSYAQHATREVATAATDPAPELDAAYDVHWFDHLDSPALRGWLYFHSAVAGLPEDAADEFVLAVHEAATTASSAAQDSEVPTGRATFDEPTLGVPRIPVRIWPWLTQVTCDIPVNAALPGIATPLIPADSRLSSLWLADKTCTNVRIDVHSDAVSGSRIRVYADRYGQESGS